MKNLTLLFALGFILITSCSKDESLEQTDLQTFDSVYVLNQFNDASYWDTLVLEESQKSLEEPQRSIDYLISDNAHTNGYYQPSSRNGITVTWSGTQNHNRTRGIADIKQTSPNINFHFVLETECVMVYGNQAV